MIRTYTCQEHVYIYAGVEAYGGQRATGTNSHGSKRHELVRYLFHGLSHYTQHWNGSKWRTEVDHFIVAILKSGQLYCIAILELWA